MSVNPFRLQEDSVADSDLLLSIEQKKQLKKRHEKVLSRTERLHMLLGCVRLYPIYIAVYFTFKPRYMCRKYTAFLLYIDTFFISSFSCIVLLHLQDVSPHYLYLLILCIVY